MRHRRHLREARRFLIVGGVAFVVEVTLYNLLVFVGPDGRGLLGDKPVTAKALAVVAAMAVAYAGNRTWTYGDRPRRGVVRELGAFTLVNGLALGVAAAPLAVSRYALHLSGPVPDNIAANVVGIGLATGFRFLAYRTFVFRDVPDVVVRSPADVVDAPSRTVTDARHDRSRTQTG